MKTIQKLLILAVLIICAAIYSCQKETGEKSKLEKTRSETKALSNVPSDSEPKLGWSPKGSEIKTTDNGIEVIPPVGWSYIGFDKKRGFFELNTGKGKSITCTCNVNGDCRPFSASGPWGTQQGCLGTCSDCTMKQGFSLEDRVIDIQSGGYYSKMVATRVLKNGETAPAVFEALFELDDFKKEFISFMKKAFNGKRAENAITNEDGSISAPIGYSLVAISIMGRGMAVVLPDEFVEAQLGQSYAAKGSCSCSGNGTCNVKSLTILGTGSTWCETKDCKGCTLTINSLSSVQGGYSVQLNSYAY